MPESADYLTLDVYDQPPGGPRHWSRSVNAALQQGIPGLRSVTVNHSNHLSHSLDLRTLIRPGRALIAAWDSPESALAAFRGPLAGAVRSPRRYSLDGEVVRVRRERPLDDWYGWNPSAEGSRPILETSGVTRRSIYLNFPGGKSELVAAATQSSGDEMTDILRSYLERPDPIAAFIQMWCDALISSDFRSGCAIVAAACGREDAPEAAVAAADVFRQWADLLTEALARDGIDHDVAESLSTTVVAAVEGAIILARAARSTTPLEQVSGHLKELVAVHRPASVPHGADAK